MNSLSTGQVYGQMRQKLNHLASVTCNGDVQVRCCFSSSAAHFSQPAPGLTEQLAIKHYKVCLRSTCNFLCSLESEILLSRMERHSRFDSFGNSVDVFLLLLVKAGRPQKCVWLLVVLFFPLDRLVCVVTFLFLFSYWYNDLVCIQGPIPPWLFMTVRAFKMKHIIYTLMMVITSGSGAVWLPVVPVHCTKLLE